MATPEQVAELKTVADALTEKEDEIRTQLINLEEANEQLLGNIDTTKEAATRATDPAQVAALNRRAADLQTQLDQGLTQEKQLAASLKEVAQQANQARTRARAAEDILKQQQAASEPKPQPQPPATASQTAQDDAPAGPTAAPAQKVDANGRVVPTPDTTSPTNATPTPTQETPEGTESGTDAPVKTTEQTQAINTDSNNGQPPVAPATDESAAETARLASKNSATTDPGVAAPKDDAANTSSRTVQNTVDAGDNDDVKIVAQPNILDEYNSYTYTASVYLLTNEQHARLQNSKNKTVDGYYLLFQSGGAPGNVGGERNPSLRSAANADNDFNNSAPVLPDGGRNPFFPDDFYIDSISLKTVIAGKGTGSAHNASELKFTVVEPSGITLLDNLYKAVQNIAPKDAAGKVNYTAMTYLMVIRFYGYDQEGNLVQVSAKQDAEGTSDRSAVVEKFIPFQISNINWSVGSKLVTYEWDCTPVGQQIAGGTVRGTIPKDVQLVNSTVGGLLSNNRVTVANSSGDENQNETAKFLRQQATAQQTGGNGRVSDNDRATQNYNNSNEFAGMQEQGTTPSSTTPAPAASKPAPAPANAAPSNKIIAGLMASMNETQQELVKRGIYSIADVYSIEFVGPGAKAISGAKLQLPNAKVDKKQTASGASTTKEGGAALDPNRQAVDMVSRTFSITAGQQLLQVIEQVIRNSSYVTDQALVVLNPDGTYTPNPKANPSKPMKWFEISMSATAIGDKIDPLRNDYAYDIKYVVRQKIIPNFDSKYFPVSTFTGVHKSYPYWFTGNNTAVLEYQETLNALYHVTVSGDAKVGEDRTKREQYTSSLADVRKYAYSPRSNASSQGAGGKEYELGANAAEVIYSPGDLAQAKVKIVGDPAWIQQGSLFRSAEQIISTSNGFDPDGSISFDSTMPMFEVVWQRPQDYDIETGLADPYAKQPSEYNRSPQQSRVYVATEITSEFNKGAFTQTLEGSLYLFPIPGKNKPVSPPDADRKNTVSEAERAKIRASAIADTPREVSSLASRYPPPPSSSVTGTTPTSSTAKGVESTLNPPKTLAEPTLAQLQASPAYIAARRAGQTPEAALQTARQSFGATAGGSPVTSNGQAVANNTGSAPNRLPPSPNTVTPSNAAAARQGQSTQSPTTPTNAGNQLQAIER
jgi:hypothetical protein